MPVEPETSPVVIVLALAAAAAVAGAWAVAFRDRRRLRDLVVWILAHHGARWQAVPELTRRLNPAGAVEHLRREGLGDNPDFMSRYRTVKQGKRGQIMLQLVGVVLIGAIMLGVRYLDWIW